ncbi:MAG: aldo/keto reductase [Bacilli bacterium]|nr:aldo/keto reductase [Bacilli bacterium]
MKYRILGKTNAKVSEISLGCWQLGGKWGDPYNDELAMETLQIATNNNITCFDTADVYQGGMSENAIGRYIKTIENPPFVITKIGRRSNPHIKEAYNEKVLRGYVDDSLKNMDVDSLDLVLLHCPPTDVYYMPEVFQVMDALKAEGKIKHYGVSVERIEEGLKAMEYDGVDAIEIIFNMFRLRPTELFFEQAKKHNIGVIVRVPLASGLLSGKFSRETTFKEGDHRFFNRNGEAFDKGETFSGVDFETGLNAVEDLKKVFQGKSLPQMALRYILMFDAVSTVIPGASKASHVESNVQASELPPLTKEEMEAVQTIYDTYIKDPVHQLW